MNDTALQFTLRESRRAVAAPLLWIALAGAAFVLGLTGPFGTYEILPLPARIAYWAAIATSTYFIAYAVVTFTERCIFPDGRPSAPVFALLGALAGPPIAGFVWLANWSVFAGLQPAIDFLPLLAYCTIIAATASCVIAIFSRQFAQESVAAPAAPVERAAIMDRLPLQTRGRLLFMSMQDHYVEVHTDKGSHLILMRLADAIAKTKGVDGLQIHRSHWVARDAVTGSARRNGRLVLHIAERAELPVSRSNLSAVRDAGLL